MKKTLVFALLLAAGCADSTTGPADDPAAPFEASFQQAASDFAVPYEVVRAIAFAQTRFHDLQGDSHSGQWGVMGLQDAAIAEAAALLALPEETIRTRVDANVGAAAAIVADRRTQGATWNEAALAVARLDQQGLRIHWLLKFSRAAKAAGFSTEAIEPGPVYFGGGEYPGSDWIPANTGNYTNASRGDAQIDKVIIHDVEGSYEGCISWFQNPNANVSAHYVIANEGYITQMVREADIAWHAGNWDYNERSVGIEHEGYASDPNSYPETMYAASSGLTAYLCDKFSITCNRTNVIAHKEVPGATHTDPGPYWKWDHYMELVLQGGGTQLASLVGYVREGDIYEGLPIAGATVTLNNGQTTTTDADGYYEFNELEFALYEVTATAEGYEPGIDTKEVDAPSTYWKSIALTKLSAEEDGGGGGGGCSTTGTASGSPLAALSLLALALLRRRS